MLEAGTGGCLYSFSIAGYSEEADVGSSVLLGHCTRVGIFRTENSVQYRGRCRLTVSTFIIKGIPCGYKMEFLNCQCLFRRSAHSNCQFILVSLSDLYYNNV